MSMLTSIKIFFLLFTLAARAMSPEDEILFSQANQEFQKGSYTKAILLAEKISGQDTKTQSEKAFFLATSHAKLQAFQKSLAFYKTAESLQHPAENLAYDYGQALYATQNLAEAEKQFKKSIVKKFKIGASAYYVAFLRELQEDKAGAKDFYSRIQRLQSDPDQVKQPALFQIAELEYNQHSAETNARKRLLLLKKVLPLYKKARDFSKGTPAALQAESKIARIEQELAAEAERMINGNPLPRQAYSVRLSQDFTYDSNVITEAEGALIQVSDKDSIISETGILAKYQFNWKRRFSFIPEFYGTATFHSRRSTPQVFQNDNIVIAPALRSKWEHWSGGKAATMLLDLEYNLMLRDYEQQHKRPYYTRSLNLVLGERVNWFSCGSTTLKLALKAAENYNPERNYYSPQVTFQQNVKIFSAYDLQNTFTADYLRARNDFNDERNYKWRQSATLTDLFEKVDITPTASLTIKDTMKQKGSRGNEWLVNGSLEGSRDFGGIEGSLEYAYTKNYSKSKDQYQYTKHEVRVGASYTF